MYMYMHAVTCSDYLYRVLATNVHVYAWCYLFRLPVSSSGHQWTCICMLLPVQITCIEFWPPMMQDQGKAPGVMDAQKKDVSIFLLLIKIVKLLFLKGA